MLTVAKTAVQVQKKIRRNTLFGGDHSDAAKNCPGGVSSSEVIIEAGCNHDFDLEVNTLGFTTPTRPSDEQGGNERIDNPRRIDNHKHEY